MASYRQFEDLPVWQAATDLAAAIFELTAHAAWRYRGDLVNQIRRASLSVSNNIAEGFERGSTRDLINFLYIARGSCGETRSMLRFAPKLGGMEGELAPMEGCAARCESVSRQLYGWIDALQNSEIEGQRHLNDETRVAHAKSRAREEFRAKFNPLAAEAAARKGMDALTAYNRAWVEARVALCDAEAQALAKEDAPKCPVCGAAMAKRHDRFGKPFWGCTKYPCCRGTLPYKEWQSEI